jgi:hypothetical protein
LKLRQHLSPSRSALVRARMSMPMMLANET